MYNPAATPADLSGYTFTSGIPGTIPAGILLSPGDTLYVVSDILNWKREVKQVVCGDGKLSNEGETVELRNKSGMVADIVKYSPGSGWPAQAFQTNVVMTLKSAVPDNHFGENREAVELWRITTVKTEAETDFVVYPNPASGKLTISVPGYTGLTIQLYSATGVLVREAKTNAAGEVVFDVSMLNEGIYLVRQGSKVAKVMVVKSR